MAERLTKAQRARLVPEGLAERITVMDDETLLAVHDFCHQEMERRYGTPKRSETARQALRTSKESKDA